MSWITVGVMAATAVAGAAQQSSKRKQEQKYINGQIDSNRYSPWTGQHQQIGQATADPMSGAITGMAAGAQLGQGISKGVGASTKPDAIDPTGGIGKTPDLQYQGKGSLGSGQMTADLGKMGSSNSMYENMNSPYGKGLSGSMFASNDYKFGK